jgi:protein phosphatase PTC7
MVFVKVEKGGEDAFFVSNYNGGVIAVADGVSGYACYFLTIWLFSSAILGRAVSLATSGGTLILLKVL